MAATLACGPGALLSHGSAAALWRIGKDQGGPIDVSVTSGSARHPGIALHRRSSLTERERTTCERIPVTTPIVTLIDLAAMLGGGQLERAIGEADRLGLASPGALRAALDELERRPGIRVLRTLLDRHTFRLTDSELERRFLPLVQRAGLSAPQTRRRVNGYRVDFFWPELGLVVETDGLRYHRTAAQQARDRERDQAHAAAGLTPLRFTHAQVRYEPERVRATLAAVAERRR